MIDTNIIQSLGAGSGIDTKSLVSQLVEIERAAPQNRIDNTREETQTQISDYGLLSSALAELQDAATLLTDPEGLFSKSASFTESDALVPTELGTDVEVGTYNFTVEEIAQSQSLAFDGVSDPTAAVGEGTLTFSFGEWTRNDNGTTGDASDDFVDGTSTFSINGDKESFDIVIDSSNNSLEGLRDAINDADMGVSASIIFDGTDYHLSILSESGQKNELQIVADETTTGGDATDTVGLSNFAFNASLVGADLAARETQFGQDAKLTLNGLEVYRSSNTIDDIVEGLSLDVLKAEPGETVTITVSDDKTYAEDAIRNFVDAYNLFLEAIEPAFGTKEIENEDGETQTVQGSLSNDSLGKNILTQIRGVIAQGVPGLADSAFTALTNLGIRTELDGTLSISEEEFDRALDENFEDVQKLLAPNTATSDNSIAINSFNEATTAGEYEVVVTQAPTKGDYLGAAYTSLDTTTGDFSFQLVVDGNVTDTLTLDAAVYSSDTELAAALQSLINSDSNLQDAGSRVTVTVEGGAFNITSNKYGANSTVDFISAGAEFETNLGISNNVGTRTDGLTVAGTINGVTAFGSANVLLPALGEPGEGLALLIGENATSATVNFSRGFAGDLENLIDQLMDSSGPITTRSDSLNDTLENLDEDQEALDRRMSAYEERLIQQYIAMEEILNSLSTSGSFLENLINTLPFTAGND